MSHLQTRTIVLLSLAVFVAVASPGVADETAHISVAETLEAEVKAGVQRDVLREKTKNFGWSDPGCKISGYPVIERTLALDSSGRVRRLIQKQIVSHGSIDTIRSYFDEDGVLRLIDHELGSTVDRVFLDPTGRIVGSVVSHDSRITWKPASLDLSDYFMRPSSATGAKSVFSREEPACKPSAG